MFQSGDEPDRHSIYVVEVTAKDMVRRKEGRSFQRDEYYRNPDLYAPTFAKELLPLCTLVVNCIYWDNRFPKLFTHEELKAAVQSGRDRLLGVCDITCDEDGSVPTKKFTHIDQPFFIYDVLEDHVTHDMNGPGVLFHAVDHLPCELPAEASTHFGNCLIPFLEKLANSKSAMGSYESMTDLPEQMRGAIICHGGKLSPNFEYIAEIRRASDRDQANPAGMSDDRARSAGI